MTIDAETDRLGAEVERLREHEARAGEARERLAAYCRSRGYVVPEWEMVDAEATADGVTIVVERRGDGDE